VIRLPEEREPELLGWFVACLVLSAIVVAAFLLLGDISSPKQARLIALPAQPAANVILAADCRKPVGSSERACPARKRETALVVAGQQN